MTTNIQLLRSSVPYKRPSAAPLLEGQAAINYSAAEPGLFFRLTDGRLGKVGPMAVTDNGLAPNSAPAGEVGNSVGETWLNAQVSLYSPVEYVFDGNEFVTANGFKVELSSGDFTLMRTLNLQRLVTNELHVDGPAVIGGNITPNGQSCAYFLGLSTERWDYAFLCNLDVSKNGLISLDLTVGQDVAIGRDLTVSRHVKSNLTPDINATRFLGTTVNQWAGTHTKDLWTYGNTQIGSSCVSVLTVDATSTFNCEVNFEQPIQIDQIGKACTDELLIFATTTVKCPMTFESYIQVPEIGTSCNEPLTIKSKPTFKCETIFEQPIKIDQIGTSCDETLDILSQTAFKCGVTFEEPILIDKIGNSCNDTLTINSTTTVKCPITFEGSITFPPSAIPDPIFKGTIILGDGCSTSTVDLKGAVTLHCDMLPDTTNVRSIGTSAKKLKNIYSTNISASSFAGGSFSGTTIAGTAISGTSLALTAKGTSAVTQDSDPDNTLVTKKWIVDKIPAAAAAIWKRNGTNISQQNASDNVIPNGANGTIGISSNKWKAVYANDVYTGDLHLKNEKGDWTMIEAEDYLTIRNNKTGKTFKLLMEEV